MSHLHSRLFGLLFCAPDAFQHTNLRYSSCQVCVTVGGGSPMYCRCSSKAGQSTCGCHGWSPCHLIDVSMLQLGVSWESTASKGSMFRSTDMILGIRQKTF